MMKHALVLTFGLMASVQGAAAQAPPTATTPPAPTATAPVPMEMAAAESCAPAKSASPHSNAVPEGTTTGQANSEALGDKLAKSGGVICPPSGVDPEIRAPTPDAGNTPVIPPPGSPGGNQNIQPK